MKLEYIYQLFLQNPKITTDSRKVEKGTIFFALKGENFDGNSYAEKAIDNGCSYAIVDNPDAVLNDKYILVDNVLKTLQLLANYHRKQLKIPIIAITGTNGKTTTKELLAYVLKKKYIISYTKGNLNNHIGVPLTLLTMNEETEVGVVEMGANHPNEIELLCQIAEPDYGIITNIGKAHLEGFGSFENVIKTKNELYDYLNKNQGKVFYNAKSELLKKLVENLKIEAISYNDKYSSVSGELIPSKQFLTLSIKIGNIIKTIDTQLVGGYNLENVLAAACIGYYFNVSEELIEEAIQEYKPSNNRSQFLKTEFNNLYLDAYNANPSSVEVSVNNFALLEKNKKCLILGDMLELGKDSEKEHFNVINLLKQYPFEKVILVGEVYSSLNIGDEYLRFRNVNDLNNWLINNKLVGYNILIKGSRGIQLEKTVENL